ncbi:MAG TPA: cyclic nucleotide-binding domain-containing protein [Candidatus Tenderia electrophaga]|uniref:Cyclic nucleotide-binding domain-containing protein n=1 Tax=Candidatus Tenderia electrophaga TaxID=1748243 RepID=A0A832J2Y2_9GAMM|nr:cyclic nucleotide-binding domain-containing protein [Candidatus Tenderia electrophaga]
MNGNNDSVNLMVLMRLQPINSLLEEQVAELADQTQEQCLRAGSTLFKEGDTSTDLIYLIEGEIEITSSSGETHTIKSSSSASRRPLSEQTPHHGTAVAISPILYISIDSDLVDTMLTWAESAAAESEEVIMSGNDIINIDTSSLKNKLQNSPNFRKLPAANIDLLLEKMEPIRICAGETIIRQGDEGDYFYVIEQGEALVTRTTDDDNNGDDAIDMIHLSEGSTFGESALISDNPRNATVSMQTNGVLLRLNKENFLKLMQEPTQDWVNYNEAMNKINKGAVWIDTRSHADFNSGHLACAINIPMNEAHRRSQGLDSSKHYICYCQTGRRSSATAFILSQYGLEVSVLKDGLPSIDTDIEMVAEAS